MKKVFLIVSFLAVHSFAADLNLNGGESVVIQPNVTTRVSCGADAGNNNSGADCTAASNGFKMQLEYCNKTYSGGTCAFQYWPLYKKANPSCIYAGMGACLEYCNKTYSGATCAEKCQ